VIRLLAATASAAVATAAATAATTMTATVTTATVKAGNSDSDNGDGGNGSGDCGDGAGDDGGNGKGDSGDSGRNIIQNACHPRCGRLLATKTVVFRQPAVLGRRIQRVVCSDAGHSGYAAIWPNRSRSRCAAIVRPREFPFAPFPSFSACAVSGGRRNQVGTCIVLEAGAMAIFSHL